MDVIKRKFYMACNCLLGNTVSLNEIFRINLRLVLLTNFAVRHCCPKIKQISRFGIKMHVEILFIEKKFGFHKNESVRSFIQGLGRLDFTHIRMLLMYKLICKSLKCHNYSLSVLERLSIMSKDFKNMCCYVGVSSNISNLVSLCKFKALLYECCKLWESAYYYYFTFFIL